MGSAGERRGHTAFDLRAPVAASIVFSMGKDEVELDATVLRATARTLAVEVTSGTGALAVAMAQGCEVALRSAEMEIRLAARPGRRIGDTPESRQVELVVLDDVDLRDLFTSRS
jgi:hypothetical protein